MTVYLASTSPRRKEILSEILAEFKQVSPQITENEYPSLTPKEKCVRLSKDKCVAAVNLIREKDMVIIASDTVVDLGGKALEKPKNKQDAYQVIKSLSARSHSVYSAVSVYKNGKMYTFCDETKVYFDTVPEEIILEYIETAEPYDKRGGYRIQGFMGNYIHRIEGDYYNVVGLPKKKLKNLLIFLNIL